MIPNGLTCKNTFFDIPEDADLPEGPATCPPSSDGWWPSSSSRPSSDGPSWPSSPGFFDLPTLNETDSTDSTVLPSPPVLNTPEAWMDSFVHRPGPFGELRAAMAAATPSPVLQTPDWFERVSAMKPQQAQSFDVLGKATTASLSDGCSSSAKSPGETSTIAQRTPDPFEDTPSPYSRSPISRFEWLLAAEVGKSDASERSPLQGSEVSGDSFGLQSSWNRSLMKPPVLLATAPGAATPATPKAGAAAGAPLAPGAVGPMPMAPLGSLPGSLPMAPLGLPMVPPMGLVPPYPLVPDGGFGLWPQGQSYMDVMHQKEPQPRKKGGTGGAGAAGGATPSNQKVPLPAGLLLPGEVSKPPGVDGEDSPCKARRKRGGRESKDPNISGDDPHGLLPSGAFIDLGLLERRKKP